ncbi:MAG: polymer-forming cytoskeletal protein [Zetaproteobacteria bacterium]|nr:polymer-forming cytoskeletal protein [Zetaproteobacteria bacterium]
MLRKREKKVNNDPQQIDTLIGVHSVITGELSFEGAVRIDGRFNGNIHADKDGTLIVSEGATIQGEVHVPSLILHGTIEGNVHTTESLKLGSTGQLNGDVQYKVLSLAEGSAINGRCNRINDTVKQASNPNKQSPVRQQKNQKLQEV